MKVVKAGYNVINDKDFAGPLQKIERIARICYKSEDKITDTSYKAMTAKLMERQHLAMFEHASLAFFIDGDMYEDYLDYHRYAYCTCYENGPCLNLDRIRVTGSLDKTRFVLSANIRAFIEFFNNIRGTRFMSMFYDLFFMVNSYIDNLMPVGEFEEFLTPENSFILRKEDGEHKEYIPTTGRYIAPITDYTQLLPEERLVHETFTVIFTCDRGVTHELVRMRDSSFAQESTRYCNYQLGKYGREITVIDPVFFKHGTVGWLKWKEACEFAEKMYLSLLDGGAIAQEARSVLPTSVKADIALTTNLYEWRHIFNLRACDATGPAHPQMKEVMVPLCLDMQVKIPCAFGTLDVKL